MRNKAGGDFERQARLAYAWQADEGDETRVRSPQQLLDMQQVSVTADEGARVTGKISEGWRRWGGLGGAR